MEDKRKDAESLAAANSSTEAPMKASDVQPGEPPSSRGRGGGQKRKVQSLSNLSSPQTTSSSKRQAREKASLLSFPQIHNGPCTRARQQPNSASAVRSELEAAAGTPESRAVKVEQELSAAVREDYEALEAKIEAEYEVIRSRDANAHVVPIHCGWFSWTKVHPLEEQALPSFFSGKLESRTPDIYMEIRNWIINKFHANPNTSIELKDLSELSVGELDVKQEVMEFLEYWGLINYHPFPESDSAVLSIDADASAKKNSLLEKLYDFHMERSCVPEVPRSSVITPTVPSRLFPESAVAEELVRPEGPSVDYHCNSCAGDCSCKRYHCQKQADFDLCTECFSSGKFGSDMSPSDFILMEPAEAAGASVGKWTDQETLLLLEALELYKENWNEIAEHVATKTKAQCILHFVQMPIEDTFMECDDETLKENADLVSTTDEARGPKDANETAEHKDRDCDNLPLLAPIEMTRPEGSTELQVSQETGENCALKALKEAFEAVGSLPSPEAKLSFAEAGNPVMALAAFLVRLVEPKVVTASARTSLKYISGNVSGLQLAARHCFLLEDPIDENKKQADSKRAVDEVVGEEGEKDENQNDNKEEENPNLVSNNSDSPRDQENEKNKNSLREEKELLLSSNGECLEISHASKEPDVVTDVKVESTLSIKSSNEDLPKDQEPTKAEESGGTYTVELPPSSPEESEDTKLEGAPSTEAPEETNKDEMLPSLSKEAPKDEMMISDSLPSEKKEREQMVSSDFMVEIGENTEDKEANDCKNDNKNPAEIKNDIYIGKIKRSAVTAISAAAVKAKILATQEEDQIRHLATLLVEKQLLKLETKLAFFTEMDSVVMRVRELLERSKQKLYHERAQIIATRLGISASSSRPMPQSLPVINRAATLFSNSAPRSPGSMPFQRPPISRPMMASAPPTSNTLVSSIVARNPVQPSNQDKLSSVGMK